MGRGAVSGSGPVGAVAWEIMWHEVPKILACNGWRRVMGMLPSRGRSGRSAGIGKRMPVRDSVGAKLQHLGIIPVFEQHPGDPFLPEGGEAGGLGRVRGVVVGR